MFNRSRIFRSAWLRYKANNHRVSFADCLRASWANARRAASPVSPACEGKTDEELRLSAFKAVFYGYWPMSTDATKRALAQRLVEAVRDDLGGHASDVAKTVAFYGSISEAQAHVIGDYAVRYKFYQTL